MKEKIYCEDCEYVVRRELRTFTNWLTCINPKMARVTKFYDERKPDYVVNPNCDWKKVNPKGECKFFKERCKSIPILDADSLEPIVEAKWWEVWK